MDSWKIFAGADPIPSDAAGCWSGGRPAGRGRSVSIASRINISVMEGGRRGGGVGAAVCVCVLGQRGVSEQLAHTNLPEVGDHIVLCTSESE